MVRLQIEVFARVRPSRPGSVAAHRVLSDDEGRARVVEFSPDRHHHGAVADHFASASPQFAFKEVFDEECQQNQVYDSVARPVVDGVLGGINGTVFAYGQTGSGKTFTVSGGDSYGTRGLVPRALEHIFSQQQPERQNPEEQEEAAAAGGGGSDGQAKLSVFVSYMELYNEAVYDLLDESHKDKPIEEWSKLALRDDRRGSLELKGLRIFEVASAHDALQLLFLGNVNRVTAETDMNRASSRSHSVFTITVEREVGRRIRTGKIHFVDLAGSERLDKHVAPSTIAAARLGRRRSMSQSRRQRTSELHRRSFSSMPGRGPPSSGDSTALTVRSAPRTPRGRSASAGRRSRRSNSISSAGSVAAAAGVTRREGRYINLSLHYLEQVVVALQDRARGMRVHVPYRNSVMTSILRDSLGGNCRTVLVATINPELAFVDESISSCRFAQRCGRLKTEVSVNEHRDLNVVVARLEREKQELLRRNRELQAHVRRPRAQHQQQQLLTDGSSQVSVPADGSVAVPPTVALPTPIDPAGHTRCQRAVAEYLRSHDDVTEMPWSSELLQFGCAFDGCHPVGATQRPALTQPPGWLPVRSATEAQLCFALMREAVRTSIASASAAQREARLMEIRISRLEGIAETMPASRPHSPITDRSHTAHGAASGVADAGGTAAGRSPPRLGLADASEAAAAAVDRVLASALTGAADDASPPPSLTPIDPLDVSVSVTGSDAGRGVAARPSPPTLLASGTPVEAQADSAAATGAPGGAEQLPRRQRGRMRGGGRPPVANGQHRRLPHASPPLADNSARSGHGSGDEDDGDDDSTREVPTILPSSASSTASRPAPTVRVSLLAPGAGGGPAGPDQTPGPRPPPPPQGARPAQSGAASSGGRGGGSRPGASALEEPAAATAEVAAESQPLLDGSQSAGDGGDQGGSPIVGGAALLQGGSPSSGADGSDEEATAGEAHAGAAATDGADATARSDGNDGMIEPSQLDDSQLQQFLVNGGVFLKHRRSGAPQSRFVWVSRDLRSILRKKTAGEASGGTVQGRLAVSDLDGARRLPAEAARAGGAALALDFGPQSLLLEVAPGGGGDGDPPVDMAVLARDVWVQAFQWLANRAASSDADPAAGEA